MSKIEELDKRQRVALEILNKELKGNADKQILNEAFNELRIVALEQRELKFSTDNRCVCCGAEIPEGRQVCPKCCDGSEEDFDVYKVFYSEVG